MNKELIQKVIRCFVIVLCFLGMLTAVGMQEREIQQWGFMLGLIVIFGLLLRNIWLTLFVGWTVFLFAFFKFEVGLIYVTNIFFGCLLYYLVKVAFKKEHINFFINAVLWFTALNIAYIALQISGNDFIFRYIAPDLSNLGQITPNITPTGFMGQRAVCGSFLALCVPLLASRDSKIAILGALGLFIPMYICRSSLAIWAGGVGLGFVLWYKIPKKVWFTIVAMVFLLCVVYYLKVEKPGYDRFPQWKRTLHDCMRHPVIGWGLDSFRNVTSYKDFRYMAEMHNIPIGEAIYPFWGKNVISYWDNPHNLLLSLFFEFGVIGLFLLGGYLRQCGMWFIKSLKEPNVIGLFGFILVAMLVSQAQFIMFLARTAIIVIIGVALFEVSIKDNA
jgi:hypothetical protein